MAAALTAAAGLAAVMALAWAVQRRTGNSGWADAFWSFGTGVGGALLAVTMSAPPTARQLLVAGLALLWSLRLGLHIAARTMQGAEDARYAQLRREWGAGFQRRLFWFLQIQAAAGLLLVLSILSAAANPALGLRLQDGLGALLLLAAIAGAGVADCQLASFKADPVNHGRVCDTGLWAWSRHPNYFFEWLGWLAYPVMAIDLAGAYPWGWLALTGPAFMYWLLVHVSGIPPLEAHMARSRGATFAAYRARTSAFLPLPPRAGPFSSDPVSRP